MHSFLTDSVLLSCPRLFHDVRARPFIPPLFLSLSSYRLRLVRGFFATLPFLSLLACLPALLSHYRNLRLSSACRCLFRAPLFPFLLFFWVRPVSKPRLSLHAFSNAQQRRRYSCGACSCRFDFGWLLCLVPPSSQPVQSERDQPGTRRAVTATARTHSGSVPTRI